MNKPLKLRVVDPVAALENLEMPVIAHSLPATMDKPLRIRDLDPVAALKDIQVSVLAHSLPTTTLKPLRPRDLNPVAVKEPKRTNLELCPILSFMKAVQPTRQRRRTLTERKRAEGKCYLPGCNEPAKVSGGKCQKCTDRAHDRYEAGK
ncbi:hypothetical protein FPANT_8698 [Fusarium pseudoanthophilum]|uniref:Uncharacterized protein n=1 Tax=Fusarium pseudoanthophilum TaxID=48495 RepID=A0A8H5KZC1_9HYPO|nr:hypothetical protein FPANT_8698 [Fusarium pseudoanthophilum]